MHEHTNILYPDSPVTNHMQTSQCNSWSTDPPFFCNLKHTKVYVISYAVGFIIATQIRPSGYSLSSYRLI